MDKDYYRKEIIQRLIYPRKLPFTVFLEQLSGGEFMLMASFLTYEKETGKHITVNELASRMEVTVPAVSRSLKRLEERGLIKRIIGEECKRNTFVTISDKGKELFDINREAIEFMVDKLIAVLTVEEIEASINFSNKVASVLESECKNYLTKTCESADI